MRILIASLISWLSTSAYSATSSEYFAIRVVDAETGRGVPLVELSTVNKISYWTDSNGLIAFLEPGLMDQEVFFHVRSHGYEYPKDFFDNRGLRLTPNAGSQAEIKIARINIAERLYRITGAGIYRDTVLLGQRPPSKLPLLNGLVMGQDTVIATPYRGKLYWFWGDTDRASYPLGNFGGSGATSELPGQGGLNAEVGIDLTYFVDKTGFSKPVCPDFGPGLQWIESLMTLKDERGAERLIARVTSANGLNTPYDWHLAVFNDQKSIFESVMRWDIHDHHDVAHPFRALVGTNEYFYLYPNYRVPARFESLTNLAAYEAFTCVADGVAYEGGHSRLDRTLEGKLQYRWRKGAARIDGGRLRELIKAGAIKPEEAWRQPHDVETGKPVHVDRGSVAWNLYRRRWVMIAGGLPGEIWFSEADTPLGPWVYFRRVVNHDQYNFYNPVHHSFFDREGGRLIYFEGTYTDSFSRAKAKTPRYDYNQIMYRLNLADSRLTLPEPVYTVQQTGSAQDLVMRPEFPDAQAWQRIDSLPFFAIPPERRIDGLTPIYKVVESKIVTLRLTPGSERDAQPLFFALPTTALPGGSKSAALESAAALPLYEYHNASTGIRLYSTDTARTEPGFVRSAEPLCRVWRNPMALLILDSTISSPVSQR